MFYYLLSRTLVLREDDALKIIDTLGRQEMSGNEEQRPAAFRIEAECVGLAFLFINRWEKTNRIRQRLGMELAKAKHKVLAIAGTIDSAEWWIRNWQAMQLTEILQGKKLVEGFSPGRIDDELKQFFRH